MPTHMCNISTSKQHTPRKGSRIYIYIYFKTDVKHYGSGVLNKHIQHVQRKIAKQGIERSSSKRMCKQYVEQLGDPKQTINIHK